MTSQSDVATAAVDKIAERYTAVDTLRAGVQMIPYIGPVIDTILAGRASRIQLARLERFVSQLHDRLVDVEAIRADLDSDEFVDFICMCLEKASRARTAAKSRRFAELVAVQVMHARPWDDADMAARLLSDLDDIHIDIVRASLAVPPEGGPFDMNRVIKLASNDQTLSAAVPISNLLNGPYPANLLQLACAELTARGLLRDVGAGTWASVMLTYFSATELTRWLADWLSMQQEV